MGDPYNDKFPSRLKCGIPNEEYFPPGEGESVRKGEGRYNGFSARPAGKFGTNVISASNSSFGADLKPRGR